MSQYERDVRFLPLFAMLSAGLLALAVMLATQGELWLTVVMVAGAVVASLFTITIQTRLLQGAQR